MGYGRGHSVSHNCLNCCRAKINRLRGAGNRKVGKDDDFIHGRRGVDSLRVAIASQ